MSSSERYPDHCYSCERPCKYAGPDPETGAMRCQQCLELAALRAELAAAREKNRELNRRAQAAESAANGFLADASHPKGFSLGRSLANYAAKHFQERAEKAESDRDALQAKLEAAERERDEARRLKGHQPGCAYITTGHPDEFSICSCWYLRVRELGSRAESAESQRDRAMELLRETLSGTISCRVDNSGRTMRQRICDHLATLAAPTQEPDELIGAIECRACSIAGGADRGVFHMPPECRPAAPAGECEHAFDGVGVLCVWCGAAFDEKGDRITDPRRVEEHRCADSDLRDLDAQQREGGE